MIFKTFQKMRTILDQKIEEAKKNGRDVEAINDFYIKNDKKLLKRKTVQLTHMQASGLLVKMPKNESL